MCCRYILFFMILLSNLRVLQCFTHINIDTTGLFVPYTIGVLGYIKKNIPISNYKLNGISGGSWASILYHFEDDLSNHDDIWNALVGEDEKYKVRLDKNLDKFQMIIKANMMERYKHIEDEKVKSAPISVIVSRIRNLKIENEKITNFKNMEELLNYCVCSSYIPYMSGSTFSKEYNGSRYIDGAILKKEEHFDCVDSCKNSIYVHKSIWGRKFSYKGYFYLDKEISTELFENGWEDTAKNHDKILERLRLNKNNANGI